MKVERELGWSTMSMAVAAALVLAGCSTAGSGPTSSAPSTNAMAGPASSRPGPDADLATTAFGVDLDRALAEAGRIQPGGTVTKIEMSYDGAANAWVWKVDSQQGTDQHEIKVDAESGRVLADDRDQESANPVAVDPRKLTPKDAEARALALQPGSVAKWALEYDDGVQRYAYDIRAPGSSTKSVLVDVATGTARTK